MENEGPDPALLLPGTQLRERRGRWAHPARILED